MNPRSCECYHGARGGRPLFRFFRRNTSPPAPNEAERAVDLQKTDEGLQKTRTTWFSRVASLFERPTIDDDLWDSLEELLISADVGVDTSLSLIDRVKRRVLREGIIRAGEAREVLKQEMVAILTAGTGALREGDGGTFAPPVHPSTSSGRTGAEESGAEEPASEDEYLGPYVVLVVGVNGVGKTTNLAKLARWYMRQGDYVILAAADTFRAAAIDQLQVWGERVGAEVIRHQPGADPGAVVYDAMQAASSRRADVVLVDTAGRLHTKFNLMEELKKIRRVIQRIDQTAPHEVLLVVDATTGQNGLTQARAFTEAVDLTGIVLAKMDGTAKGGIALAIADQLKLPIEFLGTGEKIDDLVEFDARQYVETLFR